MAGIQTTYASAMRKREQAQRFIEAELGSAGLELEEVASKIDPTGQLLDGIRDSVAMLYEANEVFSDRDNTFGQHAAMKVMQELGKSVRAAANRAVTGV